MKKERSDQYDKMEKTIFLRTGKNYDMKKASDETGLKCPEKGKTQQHQKEDADINTLVKRFGISGTMPMSIRTPQYGDYTGVSDYQTALNTVKAAEGAFMELPAHIRKKFDNNPQKYVDFCENPANLKEMQEIGLWNKDKPIEQKPEPVEKPTKKEKPPEKPGE